MHYVDGFVLAVRTADKDEYQKYAQDAVELFKKHGALSVVECWGNDVPDGELTSFPMAVKCQEDETVVFSWITWPSKDIRDDAMQKVMEEPYFKDNPMPFDGKRLIFGGFEMIVQG